MSLNESIIEDAALEWFGELGYSIGQGPQIAPGEPTAERASFGEVGRLREAIRRLNFPFPRWRLPVRGTQTGGQLLSVTYQFDLRGG